MSKNYDYALALIENDVRNDCEYYVYSRLRDVVDGLENDNEALTRLLKDALEKKYSKEDELQAENAKLRELCAGLGNLLFMLDIDYCAACPRDTNARPCPVYSVRGGECLYKSDMRELGIEVEEWTH